MISGSTDIETLTNSANGLFSRRTFLIEFVKNLQAIDFYNLYSKAKVNDPHPFDSGDLAKNILEGQDDFKKLALALFGKHGWSSEGLEAEGIIKLAEISSAHKLALLSNVRLDWYRAIDLDKDDVIKQKLLIPAVLSLGEDKTIRREKGIIIPERSLDNEFAWIILKNPRMDRRFVADVIRGKGEFGAIPLVERLWAGINTIQVKRIGLDKNAPDSIWMHYDEPSKAFLAIIREAVDTKNPFLKISWQPIICYYANNNLEVHNEDWLTPEDIQQTEKLEWREQINARQDAAINHVLEWAVGVGINEPLEIKFDGKTQQSEYPLFDVYGKGIFATMLIYKTLENYSATDRGKELIKKYIASGGSEDWCLRAGAYAAIYGAGESSIAYTGKFIKQYSKDAHALLRGLALNKIFWKTCKKSVYRGVETILEKAEITIDPITLAFLDKLMWNIFYLEAISHEPIPLDEASLNGDLSKVLSANTATLGTLRKEIARLHQWIFWTAIMVAAICLRRYF